MKNLLDQFVKMNTSIIDERGIHPLQALVARPGSTQVVALAVGAMDGYIYFFSLLQQEPWQEFVFGFDIYTLPDRGTELDSAVIVFHGRAGEAVRVGVLEYQWAADGVQTKPINWENEFWACRYADLADGLIEKTNEAR